MLNPFIVGNESEASFPKITLAADDVLDKELGSDGCLAAQPDDIFVQDA